MIKLMLVGGTGCISGGIADLAARSGRFDVYMLNRGNRTDFIPPGTHCLTADIRDADDVRRKLDGLHFDVVADFLSYEPGQLERTLDLFRGRCDQFIFISSAAVYRTKSPDEIITEDGTMVGNTVWSYGRNKILCEKHLAGEHTRSGLKVTIVRPSFTYNQLRILYPVAPAHQTYSWTIANRLLLGKPLPIHDDGQAFCTVTHVSDFAKGFLGLCANPDAYGEAFHITSDHYYTWSRLAELIADALGVTARLCPIPAHELGFALGGDFGEKLIYFSHNAFLNSRKIRTLVPDFSCETRFEAGIRQCIRFYTEHPAYQVIDTAFDQKLDDLVGSFG
ncbi:MAG: NAD-dependent epimerase/dehydratase family protein [Clostridiaceae bacterium]|jgi:nucleoside-diphosphate-sugar epimerase|nr:NAD-dependent epimerase/dehydratase family protein [Clostridiaceae bacterium]